MHHKIRQVKGVGLSINIGVSVLYRRFLQERTDRNIFQRPVSTLEHEPVKQAPGRAAIAVPERMLIAHHEVQDDRLYDGMNKMPPVLAVVSIIGKLAERFQAFK